MSDEMLHSAQTIWDYMLMGKDAASADCMIVLGSRDDRVATYAARLAEKFDYRSIVLTGGIAHRNDLLAVAWAATTSEADHFAQIMRQEGYSGALLLERRASNTGENARLSYELLASTGEMPRSLLLVTKPYMERRAQATFEAQWPDRSVTISVTSPKFSFTEYIDHDQPMETVLNIMVGDLQRIIDYPQRGYQSKQVVPQRVMSAMQVLIQAGYTQHLSS